MDNNTHVLNQIVALANANGISAKDIEVALRQENKLEKTQLSIAAKLFSYIGGILLFAGISIYIGMNWAELNSAARVLITLGSGFVLYLIGVIFARQEERKKIVAPLLFFSAYIETGGLFVLIHEYFGNDSNNWRLACLIVFGVMLTQQLLTFISARLPVLFLNTLGFGALFFSTAFDLLEVPEKWNMTCIGLSLLMIAYGLKHSVFNRTLQLAYIIGVLLFLSGTFGIVQNSPFEVLYLGVSALAIFFSIQAQSTSLLVVSALAILSFISYFTAKHFLHSVSWPFALMLFGAAFIATAAFILRIKKKYITH